MIGPESATQTLAAFLASQVPLYLAALRVLYPTETLPDPRLVSTADLAEIGAEHWPALIVAPDQMITNDARGHSQQSRPVFTVTYRMSIEGYVRADTYEATGTLVRRYASAVRSALVTSPRLRLPGQPWQGTYPRILVESITEEYAPVFEPSRGRTVGSFRTTVNLSQQETPLLPASLGDVATIEVTQTLVGVAEPLPPHGEDA